ncbi:DUF1926 domain-containing protein [Pirellulales bacterium]|nr:DUF1926 domain-containing protein [Pirellulales bacterium]
MKQPLRLVLVLHNHQPIGNFDGVIEQAYQDSYLPFLDVFERFEGMRIALHTSGSLMEWLDAHHPEYVDRLAGMVATGQLEIVGGAYFEPILTMIPPRDRVGQIETYRNWLQQRLGASVRGMWTPERVWEQSLTSDMVRAGVEYTILDDCHFKNAGLGDEQLDGYYVTEDDAHLLRVLPGSERLRYLIPFEEPHRMIDFLRETAERRPGAVMIFGDDGEKFGTWPGTKEHVYQNGWLERFFQALVDNADWLKVTTPAEAIENVPPLGKVYIPEGSYREMTEWALPAARINQFEDAQHDLQHDQKWDQIAPFIRGGYWRNFKVKYPETNAMYARMQMVSRRLQQAVENGANGELLEQARLELYRGQCNCSYWHGAFGGIYLPHLRNAVYERLIAADNLLDRIEDRDWQSGTPWVEISADDYNLDGRPEVQLANNRLLILCAPTEGGQLYEIDVKSIAHNLQASLTRRLEAYHRKVIAGADGNGDGAASIHDRVVFKQEGLDQRVAYDSWRRNSLVDHFYPGDVQLDDVAAGRAEEQGDFWFGPYEAKLRRDDGRVQLQMVREGRVGERDVRVTKGITLADDGATLEIAYLLENVPSDIGLHLAPEFNFAGLPSGADDRYFLDGRNARLGQLGEQLDLHDVDALHLVDEWLGLQVGLRFNQPTKVWAYPVETVSQSEGGFELVHQSVAVIPHWIVIPDADGRWSATFELVIDSTTAESRRGEYAEAAAS